MATKFSPVIQALRLGIITVTSSNWNTLLHIYDYLKMMRYVITPIKMFLIKIGSLQNHKIKPTLLKWSTWLTWQQLARFQCCHKKWQLVADLNLNLFQWQERLLIFTADSSLNQANQQQILLVWVLVIYSQLTSGDLV